MPGFGSKCGLRAILRGFETRFQAIFGFFGLFFGFSPERMRFGGVTGPRGQRGGAPRRLNVGNMLDVDRSPKCCFNCANTLREPY